METPLYSIFGQPPAPADPNERQPGTAPTPPQRPAPTPAPPQQPVPPQNLPSMDRRLAAIGVLLEELPALDRELRMLKQNILEDISKENQ